MSFFRRRKFLQENAELFEQNANLLRENRFFRSSTISYLKSLRAQVTNFMMANEPDGVVECYLKAWDFEKNVRGDIDCFNKESKKLTIQFELLEEFDLRGKFFTTDAEITDQGYALFDDIKSNYYDISRMLIVTRMQSDFYPEAPVHSEGEFKEVQDAVGRQKDRVLFAKIEDALREFDAVRAAKPDASKYCTPAFEVFDISSNCASNLELGVKFLKTGEFGLRTIAVDEDGKITRKFYRSDSLFGSRVSLKWTWVDLGPQFALEDRIGWRNQ